MSSTRTVSSDYALTGADSLLTAIIVDTSARTVTLTLPPTDRLAGATFPIQRLDAANDLVVASGLANISLGFTNVPNVASTSMGRGPSAFNIRLDMGYTWVIEAVG